MKVKSQFKEVITAVIPIFLVVIALHLTVAPLSNLILGKFIVGAFFLVFGQVLFLIGADMSMLPMGEMVGSTLTKSKKVLIIVIFGFICGLMITMAEPDVQVLAGQVSSVNSMISKRLLINCVSCGVGLFVAVSLIKTLMQIKLHRLLLVLYALIFVLAVIAPNDFMAVAFDSGGVTTGPITVPFLLAFGLGVAAVGGSKSSSEDSFGIIALASGGPILAVLILGCLFGQQGSGAEIVTGTTELVEHSVIGAFLESIPHTSGEVLLAILPITLIFVVFQVAFLKLPKREFKRIIVGMILTFFGLVLFLVGVEVGFSPAGEYMGNLLGNLNYNWILIPIGLVIGFFSIYTEPAVQVLIEQVESVSSGSISKKVLLNTLAIGVGISVALSMIRVLFGFSLWFYVLPGYLIALLLTRKVPPMFTAIAFDSGGVASGPMTATFVLPMVIGVCAAVGGNTLTDAFGVVAMVAMTPVIAIQILGLIYVRQLHKIDVQEALEEDDGTDDMDLSFSDDSEGV